MTKSLTRVLALLLALCLCAGCAAAAGEDEELVLFPAVDELTFDDIADDEAALADDADEDEGEIFIDDTMIEEVEELDLEIDSSVDPSDLELNPNLPDHVINILLIGIDTRSRDMDEGLQHNDVNIICSINLQDGSVKLTSILRDTYMTIPGLKNKTRINLAYSKKGGGGGERAMRTVNHNFELNIQYYVAINFFGLASIIDSIGGVDIEMSAKEARAVNAYLQKHPPAYDNSTEKRVPLSRAGGLLHCDGVQAVMFARLRSLDNDFARTARQRKLMEILLRSVIEDLDGDKLMALLRTCTEYARTNMPAMTMMNLAVQVLNSGILDKMRSGTALLEQHRIPMDKTYSYQTINGNSVVVMGTKNFPKNVQALHEFIYGSYIPAK